jgi:hypothetical protein
MEEMLILDNIIDIDNFRALHKANFPFPEGEFLTKQAVLDNGGLVALGLVRLTTEGILVINQSLPLTTRIRAIKELINNLEDTVKRVGINSCHVFVKNPDMRKLLLHLGFKDCEGEQAMVVQF